MHYSGNQTQGTMEENTTSPTMDDPCDPGPKLYTQIMGTLIFFLAWPLVVLDTKYFPLGRPAAALTGATLMVVFNVLSQDEVYAIEGRKGNLQALFLLVGMMLLSYYFDREGLLRMLALWIFGSKRKPMRYILWKVCLLSGVMAAFITNDATSLVLSPLLLTEFVRQGRPRREILPLALGIATSANIGSSSTVFGNPQNAFISSAANIVLIDFFIAELPAAILGLFMNIAMLYIIFSKVLLAKHINEGVEEREAMHRMAAGLRLQAMAGSIPEERQSIAMEHDQSKDPYLSSQIAEEREKMFGAESRLTPSGSRHSLAMSHGVRSRTCSPRPHTTTSSNAAVLHEITLPEIRITHDDDDDDNEGGREVVEVVQKSEVVFLESIEEGETTVKVKPLRERSWQELGFIGWLLFTSVLTVTLLTIPPPPTVSTQFNLGLIPLGAGILTMMVDSILNRKYAFEAMARVDWTLILMFMGLFSWLGGFQNTCIPNIIFNKLAPHMNLHTFGGVILFTVFVIVGANVFSNVPLTILIIDKLPGLCGEDTCEGPLGGLLLAWVATISGNTSLIGSVTNLIVAEKTRSTANYHLTFLRYARFGLASALVVIFSGLPLVYFLGRYAT